MKKRVIVVMPGRGSYGTSELGYLKRYHGGQAEFLSRGALQNDAASISELDGLKTFSPSKHLAGRNASNLIYACALLDFQKINRDKYEIVAICGNSLGWYLTLAASGALSIENGAQLVDTMGHLMEDNGTGSQFLYPITDENWHRDPAKTGQVNSLLQSLDDMYYSIDLSGTAVLAGSETSVKKMMNALPKIDYFPLRLPKHAAFHTPLMSPIAKMAKQALRQELFTQPKIPIIDGRGVIWRPRSTDMSALYDYTLGAQITSCYNFAKSIEVAIKEFAADQLILTGPGSSLGPPAAQELIRHSWFGLTSKQDFKALQDKAPVLLSMGREDQRRDVI